MAENHQTDPQNDGLIEGLRARIKELERLNGKNDLSLAMVFLLTPQLSNLLGLLMSQPIVTDDMVRDKMGIATVPKVALCRLRAHLKQHPLPEFGPVVIRSKRIVGFWLDNPTKEAIKARLRLANGVVGVIELSAPHAHPVKEKAPG